MPEQESRAASSASEPLARVTADREGIIREWNAVAAEVFGYTAEEVVGQKIDLIMPEEERDDHWRSYRRVMETNVIHYTPDHILDIEGVRKDGSRVHLDAMLTTTRDASGRISAVTASLREVK